MDVAKQNICNESVYSSIFREYSKTLYNFLYYKSGNEKLAEDLTQEAFLKLWINCGKVSFEKAKGYVFTTGQNLMLNTFKHNKVKLKYQNLGHSEAFNETPGFLLEEKELQQQLEQAIADLPVKQREVFLLSRIDKKTYNEIAEIIGISRQAVEKRIYNALDTLRKVSNQIK